MNLAELKLNSPPPEGIPNPSDLGNGWYLSPLPWNEYFIDKILWMGEKLSDMLSLSSKDIGLLFQTNRTEGPNVTWAHTDMFLVVKGMMLILTPQYVHKTPDYAVEYMMSELGLKGDVEPYPGFESRNPTTPSPVGVPWPEHDYAKLLKRKIFTVSSTELASPKYSPGMYYFDKDGNRYIKGLRRVITGGGFLWVTSKDEFYWELDFVVRPS